MNQKATWQFIRRALYNLKRQYGAPATVIKLLDSNTNYRTGQKTVLQERYSVGRAIIMPEAVSRRVEQGVSYISANKSFMSQAGFDHGKSTLIFDARDLPTGFVWAVDDHVEIGGDYFKVKQIDRFECDSGWIIHADHVEGATMLGNTATSIEVTQRVSLSQAGTA